MPYLSASAVVIHYEEALYQVCAPFTFTITPVVKCLILHHGQKDIILLTSIFCDKVDDVLLVGVL